MTRHSDRGSATLLVVAAATAVGCVAFVGVSVGAGALARHRAATAADLAALAAAGRIVEGPIGACSTARELAAANDATLTSCRARDGVVVVEVRVAGPGWLPVQLEARGRARAARVADISPGTHPSRAAS